MNLEDLDLDELVDEYEEDYGDEEDIYKSEQQQAENFVIERLESIAGKLFSDYQIEKLKLRLYLISRLLELGAKRQNIIVDYGILFPMPKSSQKCIERHEAVRDELLALAEEINMMK